MDLTERANLTFLRLFSAECKARCSYVVSNVPSKSLLSVRGTEGRVSSKNKGLRGKFETYLACLVVNTYAVRGRTKVLRGGSRPAARPRSLEGTLSATTLCLCVTQIYM